MEGAMENCKLFDPAMVFPDLENPELRRADRRGPGKDMECGLLIYRT
jgi:hypothetical protein